MKQFCTKLTFTLAVSSAFGNFVQFCIMNLTLDIPEQAEAEAVRSFVGIFEDSLKLRLRRKDVTPAVIVAGGKLLNVFEDILKELPASPQLEGAGREAAEVA